MTFSIQEPVRVCCNQGEVDTFLQVWCDYVQEQTGNSESLSMSRDGAFFRIRAQGDEGDPIEVRIRYVALNHLYEKAHTMADGTTNQAQAILSLSGKTDQPYSVRRLHFVLFEKGEVSKTSFLAKAWIKSTTPP